MLKEVSKKSLKWHLAVFCLSMAIFGMVIALSAFRYNPEKKTQTNYGQYSFETYYY